MNDAGHHVWIIEGIGDLKKLEKMWNSSIKKLSSAEVWGDKLCSICVYEMEGSCRNS
jgi:hypothetical protein